MGILDKLRGLGWVVGSRKVKRPSRKAAGKTPSFTSTRPSPRTPKTPTPTSTGVSAHGGLGNLNAAIRDLNSARKFGPVDSALLSNLGTCYLRKGQLAAALKQYKQALKLNPRDARALLNVGIVYAKQSESAPPRSKPRLAARALESLDNAILQDSRLPRHTITGLCCSPPQDRLPEALEDLSYAIKLDAYYAEAYEDRASLYNKLGEMKMPGQTSPAPEN